MRKQILIGALAVVVLIGCSSGGDAKYQPLPQTLADGLYTITVVMNAESEIRVPLPEVKITTGALDIPISEESAIRIRALNTGSSCGFLALNDRIITSFWDCRYSNKILTTGQFRMVPRAKERYHLIIEPKTTN